MGPSVPLKQYAEQYVGAGSVFLYRRRTVPRPISVVHQATFSWPKKKVKTVFMGKKQLMYVQVEPTDEYFVQIHKVQHQHMFRLYSQRQKQVGQRLRPSCIVFRRCTLDIHRLFRQVSMKSNQIFFLKYFQGDVRLMPIWWRITTAVGSRSFTEAVGLDKALLTSGRQGLAIRITMIRLYVIRHGAVSQAQGSYVHGTITSLLLSLGILSCEELSSLLTVGGFFFGIHLIYVSPRSGHARDIGQGLDVVH